MTRPVATLTFAMLLAVVILAGCANIRVQTDYDPQAPFSTLKTYAWSPDAGKTTDDPRIDNSLMEGRVRRAVDRELQADGYQLLEEGEPDFLVTYHAALRTKLDTTTAGAGYGGYYGYGAWGGYVHNQPTEYEQGTLIVDLIDPKANALIWRGTAQARADRGDSTPEKRTKRINDVISKILSRFPPQD